MIFGGSGGLVVKITWVIKCKKSCHTPYCLISKGCGTTHTHIVFGPLWPHDEILQNGLTDPTLPATPTLAGLREDVFHLEPNTYTTFGQLMSVFLML